MRSQRADDRRPPPPRPPAAAAAAPLARPRRLGRRHGPEISRDLPGSPGDDLRSPEISRDRPSPCSQVASCLHHYGDPATLLADPMSKASYSLFPAYARSKLAQAGPGLLSCRRAGARRERAEVAPGVGRPDGGAAAARGRERRGVCELAPGRRPTAVTRGGRAGPVSLRTSLRPTHSPTSLATSPRPSGCSTPSPRPSSASSSRPSPTGPRRPSSPPAATTSPPRP